MHIKDGTGMDVLRMSRPFNWHLHFGCYPMCGTICCPEEADVFSMAPGGFQGPLLAKIRLQPGCSFCTLSYNWQLCDANGALVYTVSGNSMQCGPNMCCQNFQFDILEPNGSHTGAYIRNMWPGCNGRCFSKADNLSVTFPPTASPEHRAGLLALTLFFDYLYCACGPGCGGRGGALLRSAQPLTSPLPSRASHRRELKRHERRVSVIYRAEASESRRESPHASSDALRCLLRTVDSHDTD